MVSGNDSYHVKDFLKQQNIPVILDRSHENSHRTHEDVDLSYKLPAILHNEGITIGLAYTEIMNPRSRNLPFNTGTAAAYGLSKEEALQLITKNISEILGIGDRLGTLEVGKEAMIVVSEGDILDMKTNKNKELYERFQEKYESASK